MAKQLRFKGYEFADQWRDALQLAANACVRYPRTKLFFATLLPEAQASTVFSEYTLGAKLSRKRDYWAGQFRGPDRQERREIRFGIFKSGTNAWTTFSLTETIVDENLLLRLLRSLAPDFSQLSLSSRDIRRIFERLEENQAAEVFINKAVAYTYRREGQISFKKEPYHTVFNRAENEGMFIDKVDFVVRGARLLHAFVARNGVAKFISGDVTFFLENILTPIVSTTSGKHELFLQSSRKPGDVTVSPIDIDFGQPVFHDRNDTLSFLSALDSMSRSGIAVLHENPYVHVSLVDFFDGSSFDIFATSPSAVTVIPQVQASAFSLNRLFNHIFENFREGRVVKPELKTWSLEDVLA